jgi:hypothetical protein
LDLEKCYDTLDTKILYDLLQDILSNNGHSIINSINNDNNFVNNNNNNNNNINNKNTCVTTNDSNAIQTAKIKLKKIKNLNNENVIHRYTVSYNIPSFDKVVNKNLKFVATSSEIIPFQESAHEIASKYKNSIITDVQNCVIKIY